MRKWREENLGVVPAGVPRTLMPSRKKATKRKTSKEISEDESGFLALAVGSTNTAMQIEQIEQGLFILRLKNCTIFPYLKFSPVTSKFFKWTCFLRNADKG